MSRSPRKAAAAKVQPADSEPAAAGAPRLGTVGITQLSDWESHLTEPNLVFTFGDARKTGLPDDSVDVIITSPPYWNKRDYGHAHQIGLEPTPDAYVAAIMECLDEWKRVLRPHGSVFLNVGDTYFNKSLIGIPGQIEWQAAKDKWLIRNRVIWAKTSGMPDPAKNRLANRHEYVIHLTYRADYYYDLAGYAEEFGNGANPGDVWTINPERNLGAHLAPYPRELVRRAITLAAPPQVCATCGIPRRRITERTAELDSSRPQARRAMELAKEKGLTPEHIRAIQAFGVSDVGKATKFQNGTGRNSREVQRLAAEAKTALGGYFREFTFANKRTVGWTDCGHETPGRGVVLDPFAGTGTTLKTAVEEGRDAIGVDLVPLMDLP
ncbi:DNA-methyltransferase [Mycobacteroides abscessus]|uniref:DNA-methyltransferase n=1 Tax=Mycobacteroides abscessus TaxID=36809 RepID=UPI0009A7DF53|nr:site-specific DNA-methyltransferase [Mycobacteroides abscessus]SKD27008.1 DNA modification methylase [Mycobacteroides abscessus subsp. massiliense]SKI14531.1 DNA modification methylase [Mycobacteroides abscessus subsp. massiliense]SKL97313.1 DNA modification methylase [Mycobacteroides abscessus subsp. massiliense]SKM68739.1 DNA modification methylase [Mycobacteroides abscessus subsp. massiliense]SKN53857.1 DNA modification methylase [Mycobacteroides abscessus subsp. massiliense]